MPDHLLLKRDLTKPIAAPDWPARVTLAPFSATLAPKIHGLMRLAYQQGGGSVAEDFDTWWAATRHDPEFDANLCFVAIDGDEPVGFVLCWTSSFVKDVVVHPDWRRRGVASAMLLTALRSLADRRHETAALKVHADNMEARRLYARLGFHKTERPEG